MGVPVEADKGFLLLRSRLLPDTLPSLDLVRRLELELTRRTPRPENMLVKLVKLPDKALLAELRRLALGGDFPVPTVQLELTDPTRRVATCAATDPLAEPRRDMR